MVSTATVDTEAMSSTRSSSSPVSAEEEPRKKGSFRQTAACHSHPLLRTSLTLLGARGGKRSVAHLSKAQLARKRANDREAQRNIRQRNKEHIENLERKVRELEDARSSESLERLLQRNRELEAEIEILKAQIAAQQIPSPMTASSEASGKLLGPQKLDWTSETPAWSKAVASGSRLAVNTELVGSSTTYPPPLESQIFTPTSDSMGYDESSQQMYTSSATPFWDNPHAFGPGASQLVTRPRPAWSGSPFPLLSGPCHPSLSGQKPSSAHPAQQENYDATNCLQFQPSVYAWQMSTKLKAPTTYVDQLMLSVIQSQRHLAVTADLTGEDLIGPRFPSVLLLFDQAGPLHSTITSPPALTELMAQYSAILSNRGFARIPEKLASFMFMYRFVQWQISPTYSTYKNLHEWQAPRPSQLMIPHPVWMDLPPWGAFRDRLIENQDKYDNVEFQNDYARNLQVNFPGDPMKALAFGNGSIMVGRALEEHLWNIEVVSMGKEFADKYPEFRDVCRFDEA